MPELFVAIRSEAAARGAGQFGSATRQMIADAAAADRSLRGFDQSLTSLGANASAVRNTILQLAGGIGAAAAVRSSVLAMADFSQVLAQIRLESGASQAEIQQVGEQIRLAGANSRFGAIESAQGLLQLVDATGDLEGSVRALPSILNLATSALVRPGEAARATTGAIKAYELAVQDAGRVSDILAAAGVAGDLAFSDLAAAVQSTGTTFNRVGFEIEDAAAAIIALNQSGFEGTRITRGLRDVLNDITSGAPNAAKALRQIGLSGADLAGRSFVEIFESLHQALADTTDPAARSRAALQLFGAISADVGLKLIDQAGRLRDLRAEFEQAGGSAQRNAQIIDQSLGGSFERLKSAVKDLSLAPTDVGAASLLGNLADATTAVIQRLSGVRSGFDDLESGTRTLARLVEITGAFALSVGGVRAGLGALSLVVGGLSLANPFNLAITAIGAAGAAVFAFRDELITLDGVTTTLGQTMADTFGFIRDLIQAAIRDISRGADEALAALERAASKRSVREPGSVIAPQRLAQPVSSDVLDPRNFPPSRIGLEPGNVLGPLPPVSLPAELDAGVGRVNAGLIDAGRSAVAFGSALVESLRAGNWLPDATTLLDFVDRFDAKLRAIEQRPTAGIGLIESIGLGQPGSPGQLAPANEIAANLGFSEVSQVRSIQQRRQDRTFRELLFPPLLEPIPLELAPPIPTPGTAGAPRPGGAAILTAEQTTAIDEFRQANQEAEIAVKVHQLAQESLRQGVKLTSDQLRVELEVLKLEALGLDANNAAVAADIASRREQAARLAAVTAETEKLEEAQRKAKETQERFSSGVRDLRFGLQTDLGVAGLPEGRRDLERQIAQITKDLPAGQAAQVRVELLAELGPLNDALRVMQSIDRVAVGIGDSLGNAVADFATGAAEGSDILKAAARDITRTLAHELISRPIADATRSSINAVAGAILPLPAAGVQPAAAGALEIQGTDALVASQNRLTGASSQQRVAIQQLGAGILGLAPGIAALAGADQEVVLGLLGLQAAVTLLPPVFALLAGTQQAASATQTASTIANTAVIGSNTAALIANTAALGVVAAALAGKALGGQIEGVIPGGGGGGFGGASPFGSSPSIPPLGPGLELLSLVTAPFALAIEGLVGLFGILAESIAGLIALIGGAAFSPFFLLFQHGGIVRKPTAGIIGEAGPEAVVPLEQYHKTVRAAAQATPPPLEPAFFNTTQALRGVEDPIFTDVITGAPLGGGIDPTRSGSGLLGGGIGGAVFGGGGGLGGVFGGGLGGGDSTLGGGIGNLFTGVVGVLGAAAEGLLGVVGGLADAAIGLVEAGIQLGVTAVAALVEGGAALAAAATTQTATSVIPFFQHGVIATRPTFGVFGEKGPEAVVPLIQAAGGYALDPVALTRLGIRNQATNEPIGTPQPGGRIGGVTLHQTFLSYDPSGIRRSAGQVARDMIRAGRSL